MKACRVCGATDKPFRKGRNTCRPCSARYARDWAKNNPERRKATKAAWEAANPDRVREHKKRDQARNKERIRAYARRRLYGLSLEQYAALVAESGGLCAICGKPETSKNRALSVDHDHKTGLVRGLLCLLCNRVVGCAKDQQSVLRAAANYLDRHAPKPIPLTGEKPASPVVQ